MIKILGIDPGLYNTGYGIIKYHKKDSPLYHIKYGLIKNKRSYSLYECIKNIFLLSKSIIKKYNPNILVLEKTFLHKNPQSLIKLNYVKGSIIAASSYISIDIKEYSVKTIKKSVSNNGNASKELVCDTVKKILNINEDIIYYDISDALAAALCYVNTIKK